MPKKATKKVAKKTPQETQEDIVYPAASYEELEQALKDGHRVEIGQASMRGELVNCQRVSTISRGWSVGRYRIVKTK